MAAALATAHIRIARPTNDFAAAKHFYCDGLGFEVTYEFADHDGFDGTVLILNGASYHLEFTKQRGVESRHAPTDEDLLVFYIRNPEDWKKSVKRLVDAGYSSVESSNPYWNRYGKLFQDPDGYGVVLYDGEWPGMVRRSNV